VTRLISNSHWSIGVLEYWKNGDDTNIFKTPGPF